LSTQILTVLDKMGLQQHRAMFMERKLTGEQLLQYKEQDLLDELKVWPGWWY